MFDVYDCRGIYVTTEKFDSLREELSWIRYYVKHGYKIVHLDKNGNPIKLP